MSDKPDKPGHGTLEGLFSRFHTGGGESSSSRNTTGGRRRKEKKRLSSTDGRVRRGLGRDRQWNVGATQDLLDYGEDLCERFDLTKAELTERAIRQYGKALEDGDVG